LLFVAVVLVGLSVVCMFDNLALLLLLLLLAG
jgi:hypothetical protein